MRTSKANKKRFNSDLLVGSLILPLAIFFLDENTLTEKPYVFLPLLIPFGLFLWIYFDTFYKIENKELVYRS